MMKVIIFALVALIATFLLPAFGALNCGSGGAADATRTSMCNCYSGFAPSSAATTDCNSNPQCPAIDENDAAVGEFPAERPVTSFYADRLYIFQKLPVVTNRLGATIRLAHPVGIPGVVAGQQGSSTCGYPGTLWNKTVNGENCEDEFRGFIPWNKHEQCGFVLDTTNPDNSTLLYKATLVTQYNETYTGYNGKQELRRMMNAYTVAVKFPKQKAVSSAVVTITMHPPQMSLQMLGSVLFDTLSGETTLTLRSTTSWPYKVDASTVAFAFFHSSKPALGVTATVAPGAALVCTSTADSTCQQEWKVTIRRGDSCDIGGEYGFNSTLACRDGASCGSALSGNFVFSMQSADFCSQDNVDASANNVFTMKAYADEAHKTPAESFIVGQYIYFVVTVEDPVSTLKGITFSNINIITKSTGLIDPIYTTSAAANNNIDLKLKEVNTIVSPGQKAELAFSFQLMRPALPNALGSVLGGASTTVSVEATVNLVYHGSDKKRDVAVSMEVSQGSANKDIVIRAEEAQAQNNEKSNAPLYTIPLFSIFFLLSFVLLY